MINSRFQFTDDDIRIIFPEIVKEPNKYGWILDFITKPHLDDDCYLIIGAKNKGGSFRCCMRLLYQLINNGREGVIVRHHYSGHFRTVREIRKMIMLIENKTNKKISQIISLPSINTVNFNCRFIRCSTNDKAITFLALEDPNGISNMSNTHEVFIEEFVKINIYGNYEKFNQVAKENLQLILNNFTRFDDELERSNTYFSINPHDYNFFLMKKIYEDVFDFTNDDTLQTLIKDTSIVARLKNWLGRSWTIRHCSVYSNWYHITKQAKEQINNYLSSDWKKEDCAFLVWGFPRDDKQSGWLFRYNLDLINLVNDKEFVSMNLRCGLDMGKLDKTVLFVSADNRLDFSEIVIIKIFTIKNSKHSPSAKIAYLLQSYLSFIRETIWWSEYRYHMTLYVGSDDYWIEDIVKNIIKTADIPLKVNFITIPKAIRGMLLLDRHLSLQSKIINNKIKYLANSGVNLFVDELKTTLYDGDKIIDRGSNDVKDAFFYSSPNHFLFNKLAKIEYNKPIKEKRHLRMSL